MLNQRRFGWFNSQTRNRSANCICPFGVQRSPASLACFYRLPASTRAIVSHFRVYLKLLLHLSRFFPPFFSRARSDRPPSNEKRSFVRGTRISQVHIAYCNNALRVFVGTNIFPYFVSTFFTSIWNIIQCFSCLIVIIIFVKWNNKVKKKKLASYCFNRNIFLLIIVLQYLMRNVLHKRIKE